MTELLVYLEALQDASYDEDWTVGWHLSIAISALERPVYWHAEGVFTDG